MHTNNTIINYLEIQSIVQSKLARLAREVDKNKIKSKIKNRVL